MFVRLEQPKSAELPIFVTLFGIVTLVRPLQYENARSSMLVTLSGIVTLVRPLQPENALFPMIVTGLPPSVEGIVTAPLGFGEMAVEALL